MSGILYPARLPQYYVTGLVFYSLLFLCTLAVFLFALITGMLGISAVARANTAVILFVLLAAACRIVFWAVQQFVFVTSEGLTDVYAAVSEMFDRVVPLLFVVICLLYLFVWSYAFLHDVSDKAKGSLALKFLRLSFLGASAVLAVLGLVFAIGACVAIASGSARSNAGFAFTVDSPNAFLAGNYVLRAIFAGLSCVTAAALMFFYSCLSVFFSGKDCFSDKGISRSSSFILCSVCLLFQSFACHLSS